MNDTANKASFTRAPLAVLFAWLVPGLGHIYLGHRLRGVILMVVVTLTFWTGVAIGGTKVVNPQSPPYWKTTLKYLANPKEFNKDENPTSIEVSGPVGITVRRSWWFYAQVFSGVHALAAYTIGNHVPDFAESGTPRHLSWPSYDIAAVYTGVAGLLNLLIILDALARAEGLGTRRLAPAVRRPGSPASGGGRKLD